MENQTAFQSVTEDTRLITVLFANQLLSDLHQNARFYEHL